MAKTSAWRRPTILWSIGYFIVNEPIYENIPHMVPTLDGHYACKRRFVQWLGAKYHTIANL